MTATGRRGGGSESHGGNRSLLYQWCRSSRKPTTQVPLGLRHPDKGKSLDTWTILLHSIFQHHYPAIHLSCAIQHCSCLWVWRKCCRVTQGGLHCTGAIMRWLSDNMWTFYANIQLKVQSISMCCMQRQPGICDLCSPFIRYPMSASISRGKAEAARWLLYTAVQCFDRFHNSSWASNWVHVPSSPSCNRAPFTLSALQFSPSSPLWISLMKALLPCSTATKCSQCVTNIQSKLPINMADNIVLSDIPLFHPVNSTHEGFALPQYCGIFSMFPWSRPRSDLFMPTPAYPLSLASKCGLPHCPKWVYIKPTSAQNRKKITSHCHRMTHINHFNVVIIHRQNDIMTWQ